MRPPIKVLIGHPTANQFFRHATTALHRHGLLRTAATAFNAGPLLKVGPVLPATLRRELERRSFPEPWASCLRTRPAREIGRLVAQRLHWGKLSQGKEAVFSVDAVFRDFDRWMSRQMEDSTAVYAYEDGALACFTRAETLGIRRVYDLPIAYWQTLRGLLTEEAERLPAWAPTLGGGLADSTDKLERKTRELELAELVVVPSHFVAGSLPSWAALKRVVIAPFGSPAPLPPDAMTAAQQARVARAAAGQPLRVLFAGSMGQRKGLGDLMAAIRRLNRRDIELVVMGSLQTSRAFYDSECPGFTYEPGRPHAEVLELMRSCDVFCLPSLVEGRALVMQEAMSQGLPLIITPHTGGTDLVAEEPAADRAGAEAVRFGRSSTGFLVPIRSPEKIAEAISWCADHREETREMGKQAADRAKAYTWAAYGDRIVAAITRLMD